MNSLESRTISQGHISFPPNSDSLRESDKDLERETDR